MKLVFLGRLADLAGAPERDLATDETLAWEALLGCLDADLADALRGETVRVARNGEVLSDKRALAAAPDDEIALLPPVSGG